MKKKIFNLLCDLSVRMIRFLSVNIFRILILSCFHGLKLAIRIFELLLVALSKLAIMVGLSVIGLADQAADTFTEPMFTEEEIERMALTLPSGIETIQAISEHCKVSMRQARKVKAYIDARLNVHRYTGVKQAV